MKLFERGQSDSRGMSKDRKITFCSCDYLSLYCNLFLSSEPLHKSKIVHISYLFMLPRQMASILLLLFETNCNYRMMYYTMICYVSIEGGIAGAACAVRAY